MDTINSLLDSLMEAVAENADQKTSDEVEGAGSEDGKRKQKEGENGEHKKMPIEPDLIAEKEINRKAADSDVDSISSENSSQPSVESVIFVKKFANSRDDEKRSGEGEEIEQKEMRKTDEEIIKEDDEGMHANEKEEVVLEIKISNLKISDSTAQVTPNASQLNLVQSENSADSLLDSAISNVIENSKEVDGVKEAKTLEVENIEIMRNEEYENGQKEIEESSSANFKTPNMLNATATPFFSPASQFYHTQYTPKKDDTVSSAESSVFDGDKASSSDSQETRTRATSFVKVCNNCGARGHLSMDCVTLESEKSVNPAPSPPFHKSPLDNGQTPFGSNENSLTSFDCFPSSPRGKATVYRGVGQRAQKTRRTWAGDRGGLHSFPNNSRFVQAHTRHVTFAPSPSTTNGTTGANQTHMQMKTQEIRSPPGCPLVIEYYSDGVGQYLNISLKDPDATP